MATYTMTIAEMMSNPITRQIFPDNYDFYLDDEQARKDFEDKFIKHYYYREIGFETPFMFAQRLESHLLLNMPYWKQLYQTELEARDINFLLNKDLRETFIREVETENSAMSNSTSNQNNQSVASVTTSQTTSGTDNGTSSTTTESQQSDNQNVTSKESLIRDGVAQPSLTDGYLTGTNSTTGANTQNVSGTSGVTSEQTTTSQAEASGNNTTTDEMKTNNKASHQDNGTSLEKTELISQGNIGITSSAQLLKEWREVLINMDKIIIDSCNDLFLKIY